MKLAHWYRQSMVHGLTFTETIIIGSHKRLARKT